ncbi:hypothetical protein halTADL_0815 [Halohasta litchfieldiae]|jgi:hypothetical protein|uniref:Uncharacterized protein n=1 Tax=Halohasta litchfieldiae TaxID=1073996 RepID=A0A1H6VB72_9EURY|nr:hypothetical protein [Halohasta litchfieldiae]ATW87613.1 hypothetical protein halTADL_0815 [Halohasta litchfieldiae]SEI97890.1 hypothetical protein SAMN05444271_11470 [Halohasta litchfieldiae]
MALVDPYFPNRPPTWSELLMIVLAAGTLLPNMIADIDSVPTVAIAFFLSTAALATERIEEWFHRIGTSGRGLLILSVFLGTFLIALLAPGLYTLFNDTVTGMLLATILYFGAFLARERTVSGWTTPDAFE